MSCPDSESRCCDISSGGSDDSDTAKDNNHTRKAETPSPTSSVASSHSGVHSFSRLTRSKALDDLTKVVFHDSCTKTHNFTHETSEALSGLETSSDISEANTENYSIAGSYCTSSYANSDSFSEASNLGNAENPSALRLNYNLRILRTHLDMSNNSHKVNVSNTRSLQKRGFYCRRCFQ